MIIRLISPDPFPDAMLAVLLEAVPRIAAEPAAAWLDVRGLDPVAVHRSLLQPLAAAGVQCSAGAALRPVAAAMAAAAAAPRELRVVPAGSERAFLTPCPLAELGVPEPLVGWLADVGITSCGDLAALPRDALEVRFGAAATQWWRWSRGDDERRLFVPVPPAQPAASVDFIDYVVTDPERLLFTTNALLGGVCDQMRERGSHARRLILRLPLANGTVWQRTLRAARPTADRAAWLRLARGVLERLTVPDSVSGVSIEVEATEPASSSQGDLFDTGFATASAVEAAVARVLEDQGPVLVAPVVNDHPLIDARGSYQPLSVHEALAQPGYGGSAGAEHLEPVGLTLQLLNEPRAVVVECTRRRDHKVPLRYRDDTWHDVVQAAGPDRVSGGQWDTTYAREYFRAVTAGGTLVWLFRDACTDRWYLHGWWD